MKSYRSAGKLTLSFSERVRLQNCTNPTFEGMGIGAKIFFFSLAIRLRHSLLELRNARLTECRALCKLRVSFAKKKLINPDK